ncbi:hypothetical protein G3I20_23955, partial [Streptomyces sp. SID8111]|nr:hypothetical protein [Streptomyces sp. SID8111]
AEAMAAAESGDPEPADADADADDVDAVTDAAGESGWITEATRQQADNDRARAAAHDRAESALRVAASRANLPDLDDAFHRAFGKTIEQADPVTLDAFRSQIEQAAAGGAQ